MKTIQQSNLDFLKDLEKNNNREWFKANKASYEKEKLLVIDFADEVLKKINQHDQIENENGKKCLHRIYRDIRFSKDKSPYKNNWPISFTRATNMRRGGYYLHIQPGNNSFVGGGFWGPNKDDLKRMRQQLSLFGDEIEAILESKEFVKHFGTLQGEKLKNGPKDFSKEDRYIELLKYKQYLMVKKYTDKEVLAPNFAAEVSKSFEKMRPFLNFMSEALCTDTNGEPLF